jgi:hypothetical protein
MRAVTTVIIAAAVVLVIALGLMVRREEPAPTEREARSAAKAERGARERGPRSARVQDRLQRMRENSVEKPARDEHAAPARQGALGAPPKPLEDRPAAHAQLPTPRYRPADDLDPDDAEDEAKLAETIRSNPDAEERASAVFFLSGGESRTVIPVLLEALSGPNPEVRLAVIEALDDYSDDIKPEALIPALSDSDEEVRFEALGVLGDMDDEEAVRDIAKRMLNDPSEDVKSLAEGILDMDDGA